MNYADALDISDFQASEEWFTRFKDRHILLNSKFK